MEQIFEQRGWTALDESRLLEMRISGSDNRLQSGQPAERQLRDFKSLIFWHRLLRSLLQIALFARFFLRRLHRPGDFGLAAAFRFPLAGACYRACHLVRPQARARANHLRPGRQDGQSDSEEFVQGVIHAV